MRQAAGPNERPTTPTFLHLYKILSVSSVLKPPKQGNCSITEADAPKISLADLKEIFHDKTSKRIENIEKLKSKLYSLIMNHVGEACEILPDLDS